MRQLVRVKFLPWMAARFRADTAAVKGRWALTASSAPTWTSGRICVLVAVSFLSGFCYAIYLLLNLGEESIEPDEL